LIYLAVIVSS